MKPGDLLKIDPLYNGVGVWDYSNLYLGNLLPNEFLIYISDRGSYKDYITVISKYGLCEINIEHIIMEQQ
jgi:hypothetical protein